MPSLRRMFRRQPDDDDTQGFNPGTGSDKGDIR